MEVYFSMYLLKDVSRSQGNILIILFQFFFFLIKPMCYILEVIYFQDIVIMVNILLCLSFLGPTPVA